MVADWVVECFVYSFPSGLFGVLCFAKSNTFVRNDMARNSIGMALSFVNKIAGSDIVNKLNLKKPAERIAYYSTRTGFQLMSTANERISQVKSLLRSPMGWGDAVDDQVFDPMLSEQQQLLQNDIIRFAQDVLRPGKEECESMNNVTPCVRELFSELKLLNYALPASLGGVQEKTSPVTSVMIAEAMAYGDLGASVQLLSNYSVVNALVRWASPAQQSFYLGRMVGDPTYKSVLAINEPGVLFNPHSLMVKASTVKNGILLNGTKTMVAGGVEADLVLVAAQLPDHSTALFAVETNTPGVTALPKNAMGLRAAGLADILFEDVLVDESSMVREAGFSWPDFLSFGSLMWCAAAVGVAQALLDYVVPYCNDRVVFGEPLSHRQSVAFMIADMATEIEAMRLMTCRAAGRAEQGLDFYREACLARQFCNTRVKRIASDGVQLLGGHGFTKEHPVERWYRDLIAVPINCNNFHA
ncbi:MAG: butyryl-CoA dehydrogenase [Gammaproteobacteria bacterium]|nr:MAG: butyryl-CoA dehydrogenase [Pseudomonadota bacterium]PIE38802.1 MAG: butyryl-CoA dehydrogenase [Gammaproteobacteria bacterium]